MADPRSEKIDKIWANRVQREIDQLQRKPPPGVSLDERTSFDETTGTCVVVIRCIVDSEEARAAAECKVGESGAADPSLGVTKLFVLSVDIGLKSRYPFEVPTTLVIEGSTHFPAGAIVEGTDPPELVSPADADVWTPSHTMATLSTTVLLSSAAKALGPLRVPRAATVILTVRGASAVVVAVGGGGGGGGPPQAAPPPPPPPALNNEPVVGEALLLASMRDLLGESMYPCKPVATGRFDEMRIALYPPRYLCVTPALRCVVAEESRLRPSIAVVVYSRSLRDLGKLHFKPHGTRLSLVFKALKDEGLDPKQAGLPTTLHVELASCEETGECVAEIKGRLEAKGVQGTRTSLAKTKALDRADKLLALAKAKAAEVDASVSKSSAAAAAGTTRGDDGGSAAAEQADEDGSGEEEDPEAAAKDAVLGVASVTEAMDLFRQSAEQYAAMSDDRHLEVLEQMHVFLQSASVLSVLSQPPPPPPSKDPAQSAPPPPPMTSDTSDDMDNEENVLQETVKTEPGQGNDDSGIVLSPQTSPQVESEQEPVAAAEAEEEKMAAAAAAAAAEEEEVPARLPGSLRDSAAPRPVSRVSLGKSASMAWDTETEEGLGAGGGTTVGVSVVGAGTMVGATTVGVETIVGATTVGATTLVGVNGWGYGCGGGHYSWGSFFVLDCLLVGFIFTPIFFLIFLVVFFATA
eukprot:CAMPEP_0171810990 /NCGR_PEP_ID=MMETSP0991-20121206/77864_1 /TAXON_ID=483369 /ORGANISM="non described non described, Strain CCMP2098" /LENGTH=691 /DNA_ID=CAMNT_0012424317 /DNA_START=101 /DNA_END=2177 /DNA_ORIENTATION=-